MSFGVPFWLWALPLCVLALALLWAWSARRATLELLGAFNTPLLARLMNSVNPRRRWLKRAVILLGISALLLALARPRWGRAEMEIERTGVDLVIALDVSRSMLAVDAGQTNRLYVAKSAIRQLMESTQGDRVGLVAFAGEAFMIAPLTRDHVAIERGLAYADPAMVSEQGSNLAEAIKKASESFERGAEGTRALLVVSDGEQLQGDAIDAARKAYKQGIRLHTAGVGSAMGARIPAERSSAFVRNAMGRAVVSRRDEQKLQQVCAAGGGVYTRIEERDSKALANWFKRMAATLPRSTEKRVLNEPAERFQWLLAVALALLAIEWLITDRRRPKQVNAVGPSKVTFPAFGVSPDNGAASEFSARARTRESRLTKHASKLWLVLAVLVCGQEASFAAPTPWQIYNQGVEAYAHGDYTNALSRWQELSVQTIPRGLQRPLWFQLGNVHFRLGEPLEQAAPEQAIELWTRSCESFRSALGIRPRDPDVLHNLKVVELRLAKLMHRLGMDAFKAAADKSPDEAIDLLRESADLLQKALTLTPTDVPLRADYEQVQRAFRQSLKARAEKSEGKGDALAGQTNPWTDQRAEDEYRAALQDLAEARRPQPTPSSSASSSQPRPEEPLDKLLAEAQERVEQKLSQLLTRRGQRDQKQGDEQADVSADQALGHYESALDHYRAAQEAQPSNREAQNGEREVRSAMEKLYVREGHAELKRGKEALAQKSSRAAPALSEALSDFETALQLNPKNQEAKAGAEEARRLLPEALNLSGQAELNAGDNSEPMSASDAFTHYQEAGKDFRQSLGLKPKQPPAEKGLKEAEEKMARSRKRAEEEAEMAAKAGQPQNKPPQTLDSLLGQVGAKVRTPELQRERQGGVRNFGQRKTHNDW